MTVLEAVEENPTSFLFPDESQGASFLDECINAFSSVSVPKKCPIQQIHTKGCDAWQIYNQLALATKYALDELPDVDVSDEEQGSDSVTGSAAEVSDVEYNEDEEMSVDGENSEEEELDGEEQEDEEDEDEFQGFDDEADNAEVDVVEKPKKDAFGLNDQFFDIDAFNKQTLEMEEQDESQTIALNDDEDEENEDEIDVFGDVDEEEGPQADSIMYEDFFGPRNPRDRRQQVQAKKRAALKKKKRPVAEEPSDDEEVANVEEDEEEEDAAQTFERVRQDLFASDSEEEQDDGTGLSAYERQKLELTKQIRALEAENVAKKNWTLMGEASSKQRPQNSLLETEVDFEQNAKPVPVVTEESTDTLEDLIKSRILDKNFDDIPRRLVSAVPDFKPSQLFDLDENKPQRSLAEEYEEEYLKKSDPTTFQSKEDKKVEKEHEEIKGLFNSVAHILDSLSSWHYVPAPAEASVEVVANAPTLSMEDVQPAAASETMALAPQEIYNATQGERTDETVTRSGIAISKAEMNHQEKQARRRRVRQKHAQKRKEMAEIRRNKTSEKVARTLESGNVQIIGSDGQLKKVEGKKKRKEKPVISSSSHLLL